MGRSGVTEEQVDDAISRRLAEFPELTEDGQLVWGNLLRIQIAQVAPYLIPAGFEIREEVADGA